MYETEFDLIRKSGIHVIQEYFPYGYFQDYIHGCNPLVNPADILDRAEKIENILGWRSYYVTILHGAVAKMMRDFHYDFLVSMIHRPELCEWILELNKEFEVIHTEVEKITEYRFK